jgi:hypothetical protein
MPYAAQLLFDAATEAAIRRLQVGENTAHRPHVSLGGCRSLRDVDAVVRSLEALAGEQAGPLRSRCRLSASFPATRACSSTASP